MLSDDSKFFQQDQPLNQIDVLRSLIVPHPLFTQTLHRFLNCLQSNRPACLVGVPGCGLSTLVKQSERLHTKSLTTEAPFALPREQNWHNLYLRLLSILEGEGYKLKKHQKLLELETEFTQKLLEQQKQCVIVDNAKHLFCGSFSPNKLYDNLSYFSSLLDSNVTYHLVGNYDLLEQIFQFECLTRQMEVIQFPTYSGKQGFQKFRSILKQFQPYLVINEEPEMQDVDFFYEFSLGCIGILQPWLLRAFLLASNNNDFLVRKTYFEKTAPLTVRIRRLLDTDLRQEKRFRELLGDDDSSDDEPPDFTTEKKPWKRPK